MAGTSCLVIPADSMQGQLSNVPWDDFAKHWKKHRSFWMEVGQKTWEIPFESWYLAETDQTCVQPSPEGMQGLLVGDVFFREYVVEFDMTGRKPIIGIGTNSQKVLSLGTVRSRCTLVHTFEIIRQRRLTRACVCFMCC